MSVQLESRIEMALNRALASPPLAVTPPLLRAALAHAVFPGGARIRPTILLSVAMACGDDRPEVSDSAAAALELIHCASLAHDDLPAFDNADLRRGKPSLHRAHGEPLAILAGDSLIVLAFETLAAAGDRAPDRLVRLIAALGRRTGAAQGICAGQAWESEPAVDLRAYHLAKTGALFIAATEMGAIAAGADPEPWEDLGRLIGEAFQVADDLKDALLPSETTGKTTGRDRALHRPSAVQTMGLAGAKGYLQDILSGAIASIPSCPGEARLAQMVQAHASRIMDIPTVARG